MVRTPDSDIYDKWAQALSSAVGLVESACGSAKGVPGSRFFTTVLPLVVVPDGLLWRVIYDDSGSIPAEPEQVKECELYVSREIEVGGKKGTPLFHCFTFSHVHFFTLTGFSSFLSKMAVNEHAWKQLFTENPLEMTLDTGL